MFNRCRSLRAATVPGVLALILAACGDDNTGDDSVLPDADAGSDAGADGGSDTGADAGDGASSDGSGDSGVPEPAWCEGTTAHLWNPLTATELEFFPDGTLLVEDAESPTGWRVNITDENSPWLAATPELLIDSFRAVNDLSGFGTQGGILIRFTAPVTDVPLTADASVNDPGWQLLDLGGESVERVPFEARLLEDGLTVVLWPLRPLRLDTEHALIVTTDVQAADGGCIAPAEATRSMLAGDGPDARMGAFAPAWRDALDRAGLSPEQVSVMTVYRTHNDLDVMRTVAEEVIAAPVAWGEAGGCGEEAPTRQCETSTTVLDYRDENGLVSTTVEPVEAAIPVTYWLPLEGEGPWPVLVYGHGLNSERTEGFEIARRMADLGFAVVAMEAVEHGQHPTVEPDEVVVSGANQPAIRFLGIDIENFRIDARALRGNFDQTNLDRLRLIALLRQDPDLNGDGTPEIDPTRVAYVGASLGAICGSQLMALSPDIDAAALIIGGARLISIVTDTEALAQFRPVIDALVGGPAIFDRLMPVAQHLIDATDSGTWAPHVIDDRFDGRTPPSILAPVGTFDEVVPPASGRALARAMNLPHLAPVVQAVDLLEVIPGGPVVGNRADGDRTAAYFQLDRVTRDERVRAAEHVDTAKSDEVAWLIQGFFGAWADGEVPVIDDPYIALGTPTELTP